MQAIPWATRVSPIHDLDWLTMCSCSVTIYESKCHCYYGGHHHTWLDARITLMDDKCFEKDAYYRHREAKRQSQREPNWAKVSSLMLHTQLSNPRVAPRAKWTPRPYCSHSAHLLRPPLCSPSWPSSRSCSISSLTENGRWESIPHHKSNHIILSFSITTLLLPPFTFSSLHHSLLFLPSACSCLGHPVPLRTGYMVWWKLEVHGWRVSPSLICNSRSCCRPVLWRKSWNWIC